jgi:hypothetical protein
MSQSSAPPSKTIFSGLAAADPWASNEWNTNEPAVMTPQTGSSMTSPAITSTKGPDFGWVTSPLPTTKPTGTGAADGIKGKGLGSSSKLPLDNGWGSDFVSPPAQPKREDPFSGAFGVSAPPLPKVTAEEDFGGWNEAVPEPTPTSAVAKAMNPATTQTPQGRPFNASVADDLWSNVWQ